MHSGYLGTAAQNQSPQASPISPSPVPSRPILSPRPVLFVFPSRGACSQAILRRCCELNLTLNLQKIKLRLSSVPFMGHFLTADGVVTDPNKVRAIRDVPMPTDVKSLQRFLGMVTYLAKFLPNLSSVCEPLSGLEFKDAEWCWLSVHDEAFQSIKSLVCEAPVLKFYDVYREVMHLSVDLAPPYFRRVSQLHLPQEL